VAVKRAFASGVGAKAITVIAGLAAVAFGVRQLGDEPYGIVVALTGAVGIFGFLDFGIGNALIGLIARSHARKDHVELRSLLASSLVFLTIVGSLALVIGVAVVWLLPSTFVLSAQGVEDQSVRIAMTVLVCGVAFAIPSSLGSKLALGLQIGYQNNLVNVLSGLTILGLAFLGTVLNGGLVYFTAVFAVVPTIANAIQTLVLLTSRKHDHRPDFGKLRAAEIFRLLPAGIPFTVMTLAGALSYQVDTLLVAYLVSASAAAGYGFLIRIFNGASVFFIAGLQQVWASTSHALEEGNLAWVRHTFIRVFGATMALYAAGAILLLVFGQTIISVWSGGEVHVGQDLILAFALWSTYSFAMTQLSFLLNGAGIIKIQAISATCMAIVNVPLSVYLTIQWGSVGPLYGSLISHVLCVGVPTTIVATRLLSGIYETAAARSPRPDLDR
jgi:O-antigen/teichoic acid export membrane protein